MATAAQRWDRLVGLGIFREDTGSRRRRRSDVYAAVGGVLVLGIAAIVVRDGTVGDFERAVFESINGLPDFLEIPMWLFQLFGLLVTPFVLAGLAFVVGKRMLGAALLATVPLKLFFEHWVIKQLVERERPITTLADVAIIRDSSSPGLSFPSGHAVFAFAIAGLVAPYLTRRWRIVVYTLAVLNGLSRLYLGAHNPLDIVSGAALGAALINLAIWVPDDPA